MLLGYDNKSPKRSGEKTTAVHNERRQSHSWVIGKTGVGKSTSLLRWAADDIRSGAGVAFFDADGRAAGTLLTLIPRSRFEDVVWFDPSEFAVSINPFDISNTAFFSKSKVVSQVVLERSYSATLAI